MSAHFDLDTYCMSNFKAHTSDESFQAYNLLKWQPQILEIVSFTY